jgi:translation initiation factor 1
MNKKNKPDTRGFVYSTDPDFRFEEENSQQETIAPKRQKLRVRLDTKNRAGKSVTLVEGFIGNSSDLEELGKKLKSYCGTGGSIKDRLIIIQGDQREKIFQYLLKNGFVLSKKV